MSKPFAEKYEQEIDALVGSKILKYMYRRTSLGMKSTVLFF
jgi:hypothetical protein